MSTLPPPRRKATKSTPSTRLKPTEAPATRTDAVVEALRLAILEQSLQPGAKLPEDAIGETFGTSRTIAREALGRLAVVGLVELKPNRGAFVANPSLAEGQEIFVVRAGLERTVAQELAGRLSSADEATLRAHVAAEEAAAGHDEAKSVRLAGEFHLLLAAMTGNQMLLRYVNEVVLRCSLIVAMYSRPHSSDCGVAEHHEIVEALVAGDSAKAVEVMTHHLSDLASRVLPNRRGEPDVRRALARYAGSVK